jgi:hypothetical protein
MVMTPFPIPRILVIEHDLNDAFAFEASVKKTGGADLHLCRHFDAPNPICKEPANTPIAIDSCLSPISSASPPLKPATHQRFARPLQ